MLNTPLEWAVATSKLMQRRANKLAHTAAYVAYLTYAANSGENSPKKDLAEFLPYPLADRELYPSVFEALLSPEGYEEYTQALKNTTFKANTFALLSMYERQSKRG